MRSGAQRLSSGKRQRVGQDTCTEEEEEPLVPEYAPDGENANPLGYNVAWTPVDRPADLSAIAEGPSREARRGWAEDLPDRFDVLDKIGEGSFGTVWTARDRRCKDATESLVALKRINPTCSPSRILNEFEHMRTLGGRENVIEVRGVLRTPGGSFALIMPYFPHDDFKDYIKTLTLSGIAAYMRSLLTALAHVHSRRVIHRDIKPKNFMYHVQSGKGLLIDFGLAEPAEKWEDRAAALAQHRDTRDKKIAALTKKQHNPKPPFGATRDTAHNKAGFPAAAVAIFDANTSPHEENCQKRSLGDEGEFRHVGLPVKASHEDLSRESATAGGHGGYRRGEPAAAAADREGTSRKHHRSEAGECGKREREGRLELLRKVERAGTTGFRAPEVLWHSRDQDPAVDVWSAGVILLCLLSRRYPFFPTADHDEMAMVQIAAVCGSDQVLRAARECGRCEVSEFPSVKKASIEVLCAPLLGGVTCDDEERRLRFQALRLVTAMLKVNPRERVSAKDALAHPFVAAA